ncbi:MAG: hypothetical protein J0G36_15055 [Afipia sp.]|nr:hypothetical protein [Afipia sp.]
MAAIDFGYHGFLLDFPGRVSDRYRSAMGTGRDRLAHCQPQANAPSFFKDMRVKGPASEIRFHCKSLQNNYIIGQSEQVAALHRRVPACRA